MFLKSALLTSRHDFELVKMFIPTGHGLNEKKLIKTLSIFHF